MARRRRNNKIKEWFWSLFSSNDAIRYMPDGPQRHARSGSFFKNAQHTAIHNSIMTAVHGNQYNTFSPTEGDRNNVTQIMSLLSQHIIRGAAHDSSPREPPPRCHPGTRVKLIARITAWFENQASLELLLWITGPAGVGKSAIVQTFAEYLAKCKLLGASVFISRPNKRDNPHGIFITIAYQLATRIEAYRAYIIERLSCDPELLRGGMQAQFMAFIVEPFVEKKIGTGGKRWGILLDGLDELRGTDAQCEIIQIISTFVREHRDAPLVWIIASRPESHITNTFEDDEIRRGYWSEHIPIDSPQACRDVELFLRSSLKTTRKKFRHSVDSNWPSDSDFLKLTAAASGLFIYAQVVMQFIGDSHHADPIARLEVLISVIERSNAVPTAENPFVHLDALYHEILSSIPSTMWPTAKRLLDKSRSTLKIPDWKVAHKKPLTFLHASFADYLKDSKRSEDFHVGSEVSVENETRWALLEIWTKYSVDDIGMAYVEPMWHQYCSKLDDKSPSKDIKKFYTSLFHDSVSHMGGVVHDSLLQPPNSSVYALLRKVHMRKLCYFLKAEGIRCLFNLVTDIVPQPWHAGLLREVQLGELEFGHLGWTEMNPAHTVHWEEEAYRNHIPKLEVVILGGVPKERVALLRAPLDGMSLYYVIPYPE
ncbi:hypothetical protein Agabi119p4_10662 [Agaricus bisporus var. burnettii]|uniref:Nephrocystin 3-like N-terminal domain-containing protein n=1 Tax=Agaricus bisporus var. burnettii TaxID=192524 RepID=A0A8H7C3A9_AGABI|nr:hypothetical protein Agabi119p4_10662 [Agaricus bisporus var. burnettii]